MRVKFEKRKRYMSKSTCKKLAITEWIIALINLVSIYLKYIGWYTAVDTPTSFLYAIVGEIFIIIAGFAMYTEKNNAFTLFSIILLSTTIIISLNISTIMYYNPLRIAICVIPISVLFIMYLISRKSSEMRQKIKHIWFIPTIVVFLFSIACTIWYIRANGISAYDLMDVCIKYPWAFIRIFAPLVIAIANVWVLSVWLLKELDVNIKGNDYKKAQISYFDDLLQRGVITQSEYDKSVNDVMTTQSDNTKYKRMRTLNMGNGGKTPAGVIVSALVIIGLIVWVISDFIWGFGFLHLIFNQ